MTTRRSARVGLSIRRAREASWWRSQVRHTWHRRSPARRAPFPGVAGVRVEVEEDGGPPGSPAAAISRADLRWLRSGAGYWAITTRSTPRWWPAAPCRPAKLLWAPNGQVVSATDGCMRVVGRNSVVLDPRALQAEQRRRFAGRAGALARDDCRRGHAVCGRSRPIGVRGSVAVLARA